MLPRAVHQSQRTSKAHLIPVEILSEIFLLIANDRDVEEDRLAHGKKLMLVCRRWNDIMLSTPGIPSQLRIRGSTKVEVVQAAIRGRRWLLDVIVDPTNKGVQENSNADEFHACFATAIQVASRWRSLYLWSFLPPREDMALHIVQHLENLEQFTYSQGCDLGSFFEPLMTAVITTATSHLTTMTLDNLNSLLYLVQPSPLPIFCSLRTLKIWLTKKMENPMNILPYLQRLESFEARHLHLPICPPGAPLPLVQTLHSLNLKSVSVQWMAGRIFPVLRACSIRFPRHIDTITLQPVTMPSCTSLKYEFNDLAPLRYFSHPPLYLLEVISGQWSVRRGNHQLVGLCPIFAVSAQSLQRLEVEVRCSEQLLVYILSLVPALGELVLTLASPNALSETFFRSFVVLDTHRDSPSEMVGPPSQITTTLCVELYHLALHYKRWLRYPERKALIPVFGDITSSRLPLDPEDSFDLWLRFDVPNQVSQESWLVEGPTERIANLVSYGLLGYEGPAVGVLGPHGIISLIRAGVDPFTRIPFEGVEYLVVWNPLSIDYLSSLHHLVGLRVGDERNILRNILPAALPHSLPLFRTLRALEAYNIHPSFLVGRAFHKLERCRVWSLQESHNLNLEIPTEMPVCTVLDVEDLTLFATLNLPQICELGVCFDRPDSNLIWEEHIVKNAKLSGLELLHVHRWEPRSVDLVQILRSLPVLKKLIVGVGNGHDLDVTFFRAFIPVNSRRASRFKHTGDEGHTLQILCPMLKSLLIEGVDPSVQPGLLMLKEVVTLRAVGGCPLKNLKFSQFYPGPGREFKLINRDRSFSMKIVKLLHGDRPFEIYV